MSTTYAQKQTPVQQKTVPTAASVLDDSTQNEGLQRKADLANAAAQPVVQRVIDAAGIGEKWHIHPEDAFHSHMKYKTFENHKVVFGDKHGCWDVCRMLKKAWGIEWIQLMKKHKVSWDACMKAIKKENDRYRGK